jgi:hypothetical protein
MIYLDKGVINLEGIIHLAKTQVDLCVAYLFCPLKPHAAESFKLGQPIHTALIHADYF